MTRNQVKRKRAKEKYENNVPWQNYLTVNDLYKSRLGLSKRKQKKRRLKKFIEERRLDKEEEVQDETTDVISPGEEEEVI